MYRGNSQADQEFQLGAPLGDHTVTLCAARTRDSGHRPLGTVVRMENDSCTVYVTARGPDNVDTEAVSNVVAESDLGGVVTSHAFGPGIVTLVVEVNSLAKEAAYELVIGRMGVALGPDWTVEADVEPPYLESSNSA